MTNPPSITRRLILWLGGATLLAWISVLTSAGFSLSKVGNELSDQYLMLAENKMEAAMIDILGNWESDFILRTLEHATSFKKALTYRYQLWEHGDVILNLGEGPFPDGPPRPGFSQTATDRVYTSEIQPGTFLQVAESLHARRQTVNRGRWHVLNFVLVSMVVILPFIIAVLWFVIRRSLAPTEVLRQEIGLRDGGNLSLMGPSGLPAELAPIAASVDQLLERLQTALDAEREFTANSAHELRTPIAGSLAQMQRLVAEIPQGSARTRARAIQESLARLGHLVEKLLQLARAESGIYIADHAIDLVRMIRLEIDDLRKKPQYAGRLMLDVDGCPTLMRRVDVEAFAILLRNLIVNALTHGLPDTPATVSVRTDGAIAIANGGPVVPLPDLEVITKRFRRGATPAAGSGLGLHIANIYVERIGGSLELASPASGREDGFEAIIRIPR
ncbi:HAMP domain-containing histidine kinase [Mesorhizobium sp. M0016]|uniref:sensor histidine kinase n=1 Tax=Mesorhizobium sp. M0016 TaxID=2956843 RepID=UPI003338E05D